MNLPEDFIRETRRVMGEDRFNRFMEAFNEDAPTSIRLNPLHSKLSARPRSTRGRFYPKGLKKDACTARTINYKLSTINYNPVPWCPEGYYLPDRPQFTFDPLFHAGCYYVQEAASMFISHILRQFLSEPVAMLDLCAAPGGKSTAARSVLPEGSTLVSNEPNPTRAQILLENITKWGWADCTVTNNYPRDFRKAKARFDIILCDVPCSGEGMFRKDPNAISEWSLQNVEKCWRLQREIVADAWECLNPGGLLIYSTCTYNIKENEENVRFFIDEYGAEPVTIPTQPEWNITGSLLEGFDAPVYRFIPGITRSEGLFVCALCKGDGGGRWKVNGGRRIVQPLQLPQKVISVLLPPSTFHQDSDTPCADLSYADTLRYLRGEALVLPTDTPRGLITVTYKGVPLGPAKNIGNRANNLYPKPWRIKTTHLPSEPPSIIDIKNL